MTIRSHSALAMTLLRVTYGIDLTEADDKYFRMVETVAHAMDNIATPGRYPVEAFPVLRYIPSWLPGGGFKKYAADTKASIAHSVDELS